VAAQKPALTFRVPPDFPKFSGETAIVDSLIVQLFHARQELEDPTWEPQARALIERVRRAAAGFGDAILSSRRRRELIVYVLDTCDARLPSIDLGTMYATVTISEALPGASLPPSLIRRAVELWPQKKRREERTRAVRELARALDCDSPTLMTMLRQARAGLRARKVRARRN
jgi:hypothetical protein